METIFYLFFQFIHLVSAPQHLPSILGHVLEKISDVCRLRFRFSPFGLRLLTLNFVTTKIRFIFYVDLLEK